MLVKFVLRSLLKVIALVALVGGASAVAADAADASLAGIHWRLVSVGGVAAEISRREPFIELDSGGRVSGGTGCNRFAGGYVVDGDYLSFGPLATTRMYCESVWSQERAILDTLPLVACWRAKDDRLELIGGNGLVLAVFQAEPGAN